MAPATPIVSTTHASYEIAPYTPGRPVPIVPVSSGIYHASETLPLSLVFLVIPAEDEDPRYISDFGKGGTLDLRPELEKQGFIVVEEEEDEDEVCVVCMERCSVWKEVEGEWIVVGLSNGDCVLVEVKEGNVVWLSDEMIVGRNTGFGEVVKLSKGVCGRFVAGYEDGSVVLWSMGREKGHVVFKGKGKINALVLNEDASQLVLSDGGGSFFVLDLENKVCKSVLRDCLEYGDVLCAAWNEGCGELVYGGEDDRVVVRKCGDGMRKDMFTFHESHVSDVVVVEDRIITCGWDGNIVIWTENGQAFLVFHRRNAVLHNIWYGGLFNGNLILYAAMSITYQGRCVVNRFEIEKWR